jgi:FKBP-type peptidyl-prolyl cis-trans isomerase
MKKSNLLLVVAIAVFAFAACTKVPRSGKMNFQSVTDSVSYALGYIEANNFKKTFERVPFKMDTANYKDLAKVVAKTALTKNYSDFRIKQFGELNEDAFYKGFINELAYGKSYFTEMSADIFLRKIFQQKKTEKDAARVEQGKANLEKGQKFLEENAKRAEVKQTESGLQYEIIKEGNGIKPTDMDRVKCVYHGTLIDGTVFDSAKERGDTTAFGVKQVIKGWTEALQMMPEGSTWRLYIPSDLAYGERGGGEKIGPNETLIFDIDLVEVVKKEKK